MLLPGKSHGQRSLVGYSPWGRKKSDMTEQLHFLSFFQAVKKLQSRRPGFDSWFGKLPWSREWLPSPVFLPGEFHGQRSLVGYNPWGPKEFDDWVANIFTFTIVDYSLWQVTVVLLYKTNKLFFFCLHRAYSLVGEWVVGDRQLRK